MISVKTEPLSIAVTYHEPEAALRAQLLAEELGLPLITGPATFTHLLTVHPTHVELVDTTTVAKPFYIDFNSSALTYRRQHGGGRQQALSRAIGLKSNKCPWVIDATAGLGRDSFILASLGCRITMFERNPILQVLLKDGLIRGLDNPETHDICSRMALIPVDIQQWGGSQPAADVLFLDPMYPHRQKSSLVKKEMRIIRQLVGDDQDADSLLSFGLSTNIRRIVVKRPKNAPFLGNKKPSTCLKEKNSRFDIYLQHQTTDNHA